MAVRVDLFHQSVDFFGNRVKPFLKLPCLHTSPQEVMPGPISDSVRSIHNRLDFASSIRTKAVQRGPG